MQTNVKIGLSAAEADKRLKKYGLNILPKEKRLTKMVILFNQFKNSLVYFLIIAAIISFALGEIVDGWVILGAVALAAVFGYFQESKAERSLWALKQIIRSAARVFRDGREEEIDATRLAPGDIILLEEGAMAPADCRIVSSFNLEANEASLTGEAAPREKSNETLEAGVSAPDRHNMVYMGTVITRGYGTGIVTGTGVNTQIGKIAESLSEVKEGATPLQKKLTIFSRWISVIVLFLAGVLFIGGILRGLDAVEIFITSVAVAVAAIPEGLIAAVSVILAIGMVRLLDKKALVRKMLAAETLGSTTVICSDKTGTITEGKMSVVDIFSASDGKAYSLAMKIALICNAARIMNPRDNFREWEIVGESTEKAILESAVNAGFSRFYFKRLAYLLDEIPFESRIQYRAMLLAGDSEIIDGSKKNILLVSGAPEKILQASHYVYKNGEEVKLYASQFQDFQDDYTKMTKEGLRVLAVAYRQVEDNIKSFKSLENPVSEMVLVGFLALKDPIRPGVAEALRLAQKSGIKAVMITGDHHHTAETIAKEIGLNVGPDNILEGRDLERMGDEELRKAVKRIVIYARIMPHDKLRIVEALQANGEVVAMTGDGVNDAPALKRADIGIAVGTATDVSKEASDMVLLDSDFSVIVEAVRQGRIIFDNIKKIITYVLSDSFSEVILIGGSLLLGFPLPLIPAQILWTNLVVDGLPTFALAFEPGEKDIMEEKPMSHKLPLIDKEMKAIIFIVGIITDILLFSIFFYFLKSGLDIKHVRTIVFAVLGFNSLIYIFSIKSLRRSVLSTGVLSNKYLVGSVLLGFFMLAAAIYFPPLQTILKTAALDLKDWFFILGLGLVEILAIEITKWYFVSRKN